MHPLIADGGEMTVLRDLAAYSYGQWSVDWPESVPDDQRPELPDDRDFGYASKLKQDPGMFGRRFVRADVDITAQDFDDAGAPIPFTGESNVEETLDETSRRTEGDVFFEREITRAGLGALVPRVDFDVDSVVPVLIWGKTIPAPVTSIEDVVESGAVVDYRVHVGGQLLQDDAARERANREVERTIAQERRERVKAVSKERKARKSAISGERAARTEAISAEAQARALADSEEARARQKAISDLSESFSTELETYGRLVEEAKNSVDPATRQVVNFWSEENQNNFNKAVQLTLSAQSAYNDINNIKWVSQDAWNTQQEKINEARDKFEAQQIEIDAAQDEVAKANSELIRMALQLAEANKKVLALLHLKNHGAWSLSGNYTITKTWMPLSFGRPKGTSEGCTLRSFPNSGTYVTLDEGGEWHISVRLYIPGQKLGPISGDNTELRIIHMRDGSVVDRSTAMGYDKGWPYTLHIDTIFNVRAGDYVYADCASDSDHGNGPLSQSDSSNEYSEFMVRQLSRG